MFPHPVITILPEQFLGGVSSIIDDIVQEISQRYRDFSVVSVHDYKSDTHYKPGESTFVYDDDEKLDVILARLEKRVGTVPILLVNGVGIDLTLGCRLRKNGTRIIYVVHGNSPYYYNSAKHYRPIIDTYVAVSSVIAHELNRLDADSEIITISNGVRVPDIFCERQASDRIRLLYVGRIEDKLKASDRAIHIISGLKELGIPYCLTFIGDGPYLPELKSRVDDLGASENVKFLGFQVRDKIMTLFAEQDIFLLFSRSEGMNMAMLEAMAYGLVPVVTDTPGVQDVIINGQNGFIVSQENFTDIVHQVKFLQENPEQRMDMSYHAWKTVYEQFNIKFTVEKYERIFSKYDAAGLWRGKVPNLICRRDVWDLPMIPNSMALKIRKILHGIKQK